MYTYVSTNCERILRNKNSRAALIYEKKWIKCVMCKKVSQLEDLNKRIPSDTILL